MAFSRKTVQYIMWVPVCAVLFSSCLSYRFTRQIQGVIVEQSAEDFDVGRTTLADVLISLGAPDTIVKIDERDLLVYERSVLHQNRLSIGIPLMDVAVGGSLDVSASGALTRYDSMAFFFTPDGILSQIAVQQGSLSPYVRTLFSD